MAYRTRTFYTPQQKTEMWDRWQRGESLNNAVSIGFFRSNIHNMKL